MQFAQTTIWNSLLIIALVMNVLLSIGLYSLNSVTTHHIDTDTVVQIANSTADLNNTTPAEIYIYKNGSLIVVPIQTKVT
jgi:uncharacterized protein YpmB